MLLGRRASGFVQVAQYLPIRRQALESDGTTKLMTDTRRTTNGTTDVEVGIN
jgi:hypothetical protein